MNKNNAQQSLYTIMQSVNIQIRCCMGCVITVRQKEVLKNFIYRSGNCTLQYHSAVYSQGADLHELSVWRTIGFYLQGYSYRYFKTSTLNRQIIQILSDAIRSTKLYIASLDGSSRVLMQAQKYLDLLLEYRYRVQTSI